MESKYGNDLQSCSSEFRENVINSSSEIIEKVEKATGSDFEKKRMNRDTQKHLEKIHQWYRESDQNERKVLGDHLSEGNFVQICVDYIKLLSEDGKNTPTEGYDADCLAVLRIICLNYTNSSNQFAVKIAKTGLFRVLVSDLVIFLDNVHDEKIHRHIIRRSLGILHNCARINKNKKYLKEPNTVEAIYLYTRIGDDQIFSETKMLAIFTLPRIIKRERSQKFLADESIIKCIVKCLGEAIEDEKHKVGGFSAYEMLSGIKHLALSDGNSVEIVRHGVLELVVKLLQEGNDSEKAICTKTIYALAFAGENKIKMCQDEKLMQILHALAETKGKVRESANGALWELQGKELYKTSYEQNIAVITVKSNIGNSAAAMRNEQDFTRAEKHLSGKEEKDKTKGKQNEQPKSSMNVMISYGHGYKEELIWEIKKELERNNYNVWIDKEQIRGNIFGAMAEGVENSTVILMCMSEKYNESEYCRSEASYARELKKRAIPIKFERDFKPYGWLGFLAAGKRYIKFDKENEFSEKFEELVGEIESQIVTPRNPVMPKGCPLQRLKDIVCKWSWFQLTIVILLLAILLKVYY